jgi:hypothetical protein
VECGERGTGPLDVLELTRLVVVVGLASLVPFGILSGLVGVGVGVCFGVGFGEGFGEWWIGVGEGFGE